MDTLGRICSGRVPLMRFKKLLGTGVVVIGRTLAYFWKVAKETDNDLARARAQRREEICDEVRNVYAP